MCMSALVFVSHACRLSSALFKRQSVLRNPRNQFAARSQIQPLPSWVARREPTTKGCTSWTHHERGLQCHGPALRPARLGSSQADLRSQGAWAASTGRSCTRKYFSCLRVHADDYTACMFTRPCLVSTIHRGAGGAGKDCICSVRTRLCAKCDMSWSKPISNSMLRCSRVKACVETCTCLCIWHTFRALPIARRPPAMSLIRVGWNSRSSGPLELKFARK